MQIPAEARPTALPIPRTNSIAKNTTPKNCGATVNLAIVSG